MGERRRKDNVLSGLGEDTVCIIKRWHGPPGIRQGQGAPIWWDLEVECPGQGGARVGVDIVVGASELD